MQPIDERVGATIIGVPEASATTRCDLRGQTIVQRLELVTCARGIAVRATLDSALEYPLPFQRSV